MSDSNVVPRRQFLKTSAAGAAAATLASAPFVHAQGGDVLRVGLIGCGGRGTGAAEQALRADANVKLVAMGDTFRDRLDQSLATLRRRNGLAEKIDVPGIASSTVEDGAPSGFQRSSNEYLPSIPVKSRTGTPRFPDKLSANSAIVALDIENDREFIGFSPRATAASRAACRSFVRA